MVEGYPPVNEGDEYIGKYTLLKVLGEGAFSQVWLVYDRVVRQYFALKIHKTENMDQQAIDTIINEVKIMQDLGYHKNLAQLVDFQFRDTLVKESGEQVPVSCLVTQKYYTGGMLFEYLAVGKFEDERVLRALFRNIVETLQYLHSKNLCHRDVKPDNIVVSEDNDIVLIDFGFAAPASGKEIPGLLKTQVGTRPYMVPEINIGIPYNGPHNDMFAAGVILYILMVGVPPFRKSHQSCQFYKRWAVNPKGFLENISQQIKRPFSQPFTDLLCKMLSTDPSQRLYASEVLDHPFMQQETASNQELKEELQRRKTIIDEKLQAEQIHQEIARHRYRGDGKDNKTIYKKKDHLQGTVFYSDYDGAGIYKTIVDGAAGMYTVVQESEKKHKYTIKYGMSLDESTEDDHETEIEMRIREESEGVVAIQMKARVGEDKLMAQIAINQVVSLWKDMIADRK